MLAAFCGYHWLFCLSYTATSQVTGFGFKRASTLRGQKKGSYVDMCDQICLISDSVTN